MNLLATFKTASAALLSTIAGSILVAVPSQAATFSLISSQLQFGNFSHSASSVSTETLTDTLVVSLGSGSAIAEAFAEALFIEDPALAGNFVVGTAEGEGSEYFAEARSEAAVQGVFDIAQGENFSFTFGGLVTFATGIDDPLRETAFAEGALSFALLGLDDFDAVQDIFDVFELTAQLDTPGNDDDLQDTLFGENLSVSVTPLLDTRQPGALEEVLQLRISGSYSKMFDTDTRVALVEAKSGYAEVAQVPGPSALWGIITLGGLGLLKLRQDDSASEVS